MRKFIISLALASTAAMAAPAAAQYQDGYRNNGYAQVDRYGRVVDQYGRVVDQGRRPDQYGRVVDQYGRVVDQYGRSDQYGQTSQYGYQQDGRQIEQRIYQLRERIQRVTQRGAVSRNESVRLQRELQDIQRRYNSFARNGLSRDEQYDLQARIQRLQAQIREDRQDGRRNDDDRRYNDDRRYDDDRRGY